MWRSLAMMFPLLSGLITGCQTGRDSDLSKEKRFWAWFQENEDSIYHFETDREAIFDRLHAEMLKVYPQAAFEIGSILRDGRREFILSASANVDGFPAVESLYATAPPFSRWIIVRFIPRRSHDPLTHTEAGGEILRTSQLRYSLQPVGNQVDISIFIDNTTGYDGEDLEYLVWHALKAFLGEEDLGIRVRNYSILDETSDGYEESREVDQLAAEFDAYFSEQKKSYH
jgi:hypothetical protein